MSSKLLRKGDTSLVQPITWDTRGGRPPLPAAPPALQQAFSGDDTGQRVGRLEAALAEAEARREAAVREARTEGYRQGEAAGLQRGRAEIEPVLESLGASLRQLIEMRPQLRLQAESDLVRLAVAIARRILNRELHTDQEAVAGLVRVALEKLRTGEVTRIRVHAEFRDAIIRVLQRGGVLAHVEVAADPSLARGGLVFETTRGDFDISVETQLREIERGLTDRFRGKE